MIESQFPYAHERQTYVSVRIIKLLATKTGTYNPMYFRPYQTHFTPEVADDLNTRIRGNGHNETTTSLLSGIANRIMMPSQQHYGLIPIVNGWDTPRGRFNMVVELTSATGSVFHYYIQGYTSHYDNSLQGTPDPNMVFYINSYIRMSRSKIMTPLGLEDRNVVTESAQVINGRLVRNLLNNNIYGMRPSDLYSVIQGEMIAGRMPQGDIPSQLRDTRHNLSNQCVPSARSNNLPANLLSKMLKSYQTGNTLLEFGQDSEDVFTKSKGYVYEGSLMESGFFRQLSNVTGVPEATTFTMANLIQIDPNVTNHRVSTFLTLNSTALRQINTAGQSETWHRPDDISAWVCSVLINAVPTIMMELMIAKLVFRASNHDSMGVTNMSFEQASDLIGQDITPALTVFKNRFVHEIMNDITYGNQELYMVYMSIDLMGDTVIDISYAGHALKRYVAPSFCDSLMSPIVTPNEGILNNNVYDFSNILKSIGSSTKNFSLNESI